MNPRGPGNGKSHTAQQPEPQQSRRGLFPIVGVGASAGGLEAFTQLLKALGPGTGMAYVLVQHLDPSHESALTELLAKATEMPVRQVTDATPVEPNHVYVIPPNVDMIISRGILRLTARTETRGYHMPIDRFLRSLAEDQGSNAIGVILSGTASDGTLGLAATKAEGGITFAQDEKSAKFDGMPQSAIAAGCVDFVLPPEAIGRKLERIRAHPYLAPASSSRTPELVPDGDPQLKNILHLLRMANEVDFSDYKPATVKRRIIRRMALHQIGTLKDYVQLLRHHPAEVEALHEDLLIKVTSFFRDPAAFEALKAEVFPGILKHRSPEEPIRVWVPGCSTGEETYSQAIALLEFLGHRSADIPIQLFGTDLSQESIGKARAGVYPESIAADVSPERLRRFFAKVEVGYRINKTIRDMCVFARQNFLQDPPFSRIDVISCRNVLIYLGPVLQKRIMPIFHYALKPRGFLMLGGAEGIIGTGSDLFELIDRKHKIYCRKSTPSGLHFDFAASQYPTHLASDKQTQKREGVVQLLDLRKEADRILLTKYAPVAVVINDDMEVLESRGHVGLYLELASGRASFNVLKMAREGLLFDLQAAINKAKTEKEGVPVRKENVPVERDGELKDVNLEVTRFKVASNRERNFLIVFEDSRPAGRAESAGTIAGEAKLSEGGKEKRSDRQSSHLKQELVATKRYLHSLVEDKEASNEELQAANEEILSSNKELQSTNEELQTAKEELESTNEELHTVNEELHNRNFELTQANNDFVNLLSSVNIAMLMLGGDLRIRRVTPQAEKLLGLIPTDVGRVITSIRPNIDVPDLEQMIAEVIKTVTVQGREVRDREGHWYSLRILPYKTESMTEGAVLTLVDINVLKNNLEEIRLSHDQLVRERRKLEEVLRQMPCGVMIAEAPSGRLILTNKQVEEILRHRFPHAASIEEYAQGKAFHLNKQPFKPEEWPLARSLTRGEVVTDEEIEYVRGDGTPVFLSVSSAPILDREGRIIAAVVTFFDLTHRKGTEEVLRSTEKLAATGRLAASFGHEINNPLQTLDGVLYLLGQSASLGEAERGHLATARAELEHVAHLTTSMLGFYRPSPSSADVKICEVLDKVLKLYGPAIRSGKFVVEKVYDSEGVIRGFPSEITQVFSNLVANALEALSPEGTLKLHVLVSRDWGNLARRGVRVFIADNGPGISAENRRRIFEPFFTTKGENGTGLGLWVASGIVDKYGGWLRVRSSTQPGRSGTCFAVFFPEQKVSTMHHTNIRLDKSA